MEDPRIPPDTGEDFADLVSASESTLDFWENTVDDETWNDA